MLFRSYRSIRVLWTLISFNFIDCIFVAGTEMSSNMFSKLFGAKSKGEAAATSTLTTLEKLQEVCFYWD